MHNILLFFRRLFGPETPIVKVIRLYISPERQMSPEDLKVRREFVFTDECKIEEKSLMIRIGERMDVALDEKTPEKDAYACRVCIAELKDILMEWRNAREDVIQEEKKENGEAVDTDTPKKPSIRMP